MARNGRSTAAALAAVVAVLAIIVGTTAATGWHRPGGDPPGADPAAAGAATRVGSAEVDAVSGAGSTAALSALPPPPDAARDPAVAARTGAPVARGADLTVERVDVDGGPTIYRVTVAAGPYQLRAMPAVLSVDGVALGVAAEADDLESLVLYTYDDRVAVAGGSLAVSYGMPGTAETVWSTSIEALG